MEAKQVFSFVDTNTNLNSNLKALLVIGVSLMVAQCFAASISGTCYTGTICQKGEYCNRNACLPCEYGFYMIKTVHKNVSCEPWTQKSGAGWTISQEGTRTSDRQWKCDRDYEEYNASGIAMCRKIAVQSTPVLVDSTSKPEQGSTTDPTGNTPKDSNEDNLLKIIVPIVVVVVILIIIALCSFLKKKQYLCFSSSQQASVQYIPKIDNEKPERNSSNESKNDGESDPFMKDGNAHNNSNGVDVINTPSASDNSNKGKRNGDGPSEPKVAVLKDDLPISSNDAGVDIPDNLSTEILPVEEDTNTHDNRDLQVALKEMFEDLCVGLGVEDGNKVIEKLKLKRVETSDGYKHDFTACLMKWSSSADRNGGLLCLLDQLEKLLRNIDRNDIADNFDNIIMEVLRIIKSIN